MKKIITILTVCTLACCVFVGCTDIETSSSKDDTSSSTSATE